MTEIIEYDKFLDVLTNNLYINSKANLLRKIANKPENYLGIYKFATLTNKLIQNNIHEKELRFNNFMVSIMTHYLGIFYTNLDKSVLYNGETLLFDQLFIYEDKLYMIEQKMRDDHDSTKKRGQFENFIKKINYLKEKYPNKQICAGMWFVDPTLKKNKKYYQFQIDNTSIKGVELYLFYGEEFTAMLEKISIWDELELYLIKWKQSVDDNLELNFENNWEVTKEELIKQVSKATWKKLIANKKIVNDIFPILFPTSKYKEILALLNI